MYKSKNHSKYSLKVHFVFVVKYRKKIINNDKEYTFWSDGYFACSIGEGTNYHTIQKYIEN